MKQWFIIFSLFVLLPFAKGQNIGYVDTKVILEKMPQYQQAKNKLNAQIQAWQKEVKTMQDELQQIQSDFESEKVLLTEEQIAEKEEEIKDKEKEIQDFINDKFGVNGKSLSLRESLIKPIQDKIWNAINVFCNNNRKKIGIMFDKNSDLVMIYTDPKYDYTDEIIKELGLDKVEDTKNTPKTKPTVRDASKSPSVLPGQKVDRLENNENRRK